MVKGQTGTVNLDTDYNTGTYNTCFGTGSGADSLGTLDVKTTRTLTIGTAGYVNDLTLAASDSTLELITGADLAGTVSGAGTINVKTDHNNANTIFGKAGGGANTLAAVNVDDTKTLTLSTTSYVTNLILDGTTAELALSGVMNGAIRGGLDDEGIVDIDGTYDNSGNETNFGVVSTYDLASINIGASGTLTLANDVYTNDLTIASGGVLNLNSGSNIVNNSSDAVISGLGTINVADDYTLATTKFGESGNALGTVNIATTKTFGVGTMSYINNVNLAGTSILNLNSGGELNGTTVKGQTATLNLNTDYNTATYSTSFGTGSGADSLNTLNVASTKTLTIGTAGYVNNLVLASGSLLELVTGADLAGTVKGLGTVNVKTDHNNTDTTFGESGSAISAVTVDNTYELTLGTASYITNLTLGTDNDDSTDATLTFSSTALLNGTIKGELDDEGVINVNNGYDNTSGVTNFGTATRDLDQINISASGELTLANNTYINDLIIASGGQLNLCAGANIINSTSDALISGDGTVDIDNDYVISSSTLIGESGNTLATLNVVATKTFSLANSKTYYIDDTNLVAGSTLAFGTNTIINGSIDLNGVGASMTGTVKGANTIVNVNEDYTSSPAILGISGTALNEVNIADTKTFTLNNTAYIDDINLTASGSILELNGSADLTGTISGSGITNVKIDYNNANTVFGTSGSSTPIGTVTVDDGTTLTLSTASFIDNLILGTDTNAGTDATLTLSSTALMTGTIKGELDDEGIVNISAAYDNSGGETNFGTGTRDLDQINIGASGTLTFANNVYTNDLIIASGGTLNLNTGSDVVNSTNNAVISGAGSVNVNDDYTLTNTLFGESGNTLGIVNVATTKTFDVGTASYIDALNLTGTGTLDLETGGQLNGTTIAGTTDGSGTVNLNISHNTSTYSTTFGTSGNAVGTVNVAGSQTLTLADSTTSYIDDLNLGSSSTLVLGTNAVTEGNVNLNATGASITGTLRGANTVLNANIDYTDTNTVFGTSGTALSRVNLSANNTLTLDNNGSAKSAYIDDINFSNANDDSLFKIIGDSNGYLLDGSFDGFTGNVVSIAISLIGDATAAENLNNMVGTSDSLTVTDDTLYLKKINMDIATEGDTYDVDSGLDFTSSVLNNSDPVTYSFLLQIAAGNILQILYDEQLSGGEIADPGFPLSQPAQEVLNVMNRWIAEGGLTSGQQEIIDELQNLQGTELVLALVDLYPYLSGSFLNSFKNLTHTVRLNVQNRLGDLRIRALNKQNNPTLFAYSDDGTYPVYFLTDDYSKNIWGEIYYGEDDVDSKERIEGYSSDYYGLTFGYDKKVSTNFTLGGTYTYEDLSTENDFLSTGSEDEMDSYNHVAGVYGMYQKNNFHVRSSATVGFHNYEQDRRISFGTYNKIAKADYDGISSTVDVGVGYDFAVRKKYENDAEIVANSETYIVQRGDTLSRIAKKHNANINEIITINNIDKRYIIHPGQKLRVPMFLMVETREVVIEKYAYKVENDTPLFGIIQERKENMSRMPEAREATQPYIIKPARNTRIPILVTIPRKETIMTEYTYIVEKGDTALGIAQNYNANLSDIVKANNLKKQHLIAVGQELKIRELTVAEIEQTKKERRDLIGNPFQSLKSTIILTPYSSLSYSYLNLDDYTETGADSANLEVKPESINILKSTIGLRYIYNKMLSNKSSWQNMLNASLSYDLLNERPKFTARYIDDATSFKVFGPKPDPLVYNFGASIGYNWHSFFIANVEYNLDVNEDLESHLFKLNLNWRF
jgi:LysM repeat protein